MTEKLVYHSQLDNAQWTRLIHACQTDLSMSERKACKIAGVSKRIGGTMLKRIRKYYPHLLSHKDVHLRQPTRKYTMIPHNHPSQVIQPGYKGPKRYKTPPGG